jgi:hypothetical protein
MQRLQLAVILLGRDLLRVLQRLLCFYGETMKVWHLFYVLWLRQLHYTPPEIKKFLNED